MSQQGASQPALVGGAPSRCPPLAISDEFYRKDTPDEARMTRSCDRYHELRKVGEGAYGQVFLAEEKGSGMMVALKKLSFWRSVDGGGKERDGVGITTLREIAHLFKINHENVVKLLEVVHGARARAARFVARGAPPCVRSPVACTAALHESSNTGRTPAQ